MKVVAIIVNIFFPGVGTLIAGKIGVGITQIILTIISIALIVTGLFSIVGIPLCIVVWIWALVSVASSNTTNTIIIKDVPQEVPTENTA